MRSSVSRPIAGGRLHALPLQAAPKPVEASKKDGTLTRPATDGAQDGDLPAFFTEGALLRLEEGLRAQREQQERRLFSEPDAVSSRTGSSGCRQTEEHLWNNVGEAQRTITQLSRSGAHGRGVQTVDSAEQTFAYKDSVPRLPD